MKIVLPGGSGQVGRILTRALLRDGIECVVLTRPPTALAASTPGVRHVPWDGSTLGSWATEIEGADVVINLAGRSVNCRYNEGNLTEMMRSRVESTRVVGQAIVAAAKPPRVWLQASTATIYAHRFDAPNDEYTGAIGGNEPGAPALWRRSIEIARTWEDELAAAPTLHTRKVVLRSAITMSPDRGGIFAMLATLCRLGFGRHGDGHQFVSWIHERDFVAAVRFLIERDDLSGVFNLCAPQPLPEREFIALLHEALCSRVALPVPRWMMAIGAVLLRTETELVLKSRRVVPGRLLQSGFSFKYPDWPAAARELVGRWKSSNAAGTPAS
jgi:uncharacterized protein (TIGR01777 family)